MNNHNFGVLMLEPSQYYYIPFKFPAEIDSITEIVPVTWAIWIITILGIQTSNQLARIWRDMTYSKTVHLNLSFLCQWLFSNTKQRAYYIPWQFLWCGDLLKMHIVLWSLKQQTLPHLSPQRLSDVEIAVPTTCHEVKWLETQGSTNTAAHTRNNTLTGGK